ncbi:hypothetical protein MICAER10613_038960 [Microcystis aeruginosa]
MAEKRQKVPTFLLCIKPALFKSLRLCVCLTIRSLRIQTPLLLHTRPLPTLLVLLVAMPLVLLVAMPRPSLLPLLNPQLLAILRRWEIREYQNPALVPKRRLIFQTKTPTKKKTIRRFGLPRILTIRRRIFLTCLNRLFANMQPAIRFSLLTKKHEIKPRKCRLGILFLRRLPLRL